MEVHILNMLDLARSEGLPHVELCMCPFGYVYIDYIKMNSWGGYMALYIHEPHHRCI